MRQNVVPNFSTDKIWSSFDNQTRSFTNTKKNREERILLNRWLRASPQVVYRRENPILVGRQTPSNNKTMLEIVRIVASIQNSTMCESVDVILLT